MSGYSTSDYSPRQQVNPPKYWLLLATVCLGGILAPLNSTMLAVALPDIRQDFDVGHAEIAWLVSSYLIAMAVAQPIGGRLGDQLGRAPMFRTGLGLFLVLSLACAIAPTFWALLVLRTGQALVGAMAIPNGMAMLRESLPTDRLGQSGGVTGSAISISAAVGPLLGAALLTVGTWRLLFLVNIPLVTAGLVCLAILHYRGTGIRTRVSLDYLGAASLAIVLVSITVLLSGFSGDEAPAVLAVAAAAFLVFGVIFVRRQFTSETPMAEWRLFRIRSYLGSTMYILLGNLVMYTTLLTIPFFVEEVQNRGEAVTGILLACISMPMAILSPIGGRLSDAYGRRPLVVAGSLLIVGATALVLAVISNDVALPLLAAALMSLGIGMSLSFGAASVAAIESTPREMAGTAAGTNSMMRYLGSIIGAGVLGAILNTDSDAPEIAVFRLIFVVLLVMACLAVAFAFLVHRFAAPRPLAPIASETKAEATVGVAGS
jgi:EmrB/QacA subfamily drug resistance transporter